MKNFHTHYSQLINSWEYRRLCQKELSQKMKKELIQKGTLIFRKYGIAKAVLFGSVISNTSHSGSDLDLLAMPVSDELYWNLRHELEEIVDYPVDLYTQNDDPKFVNKIISRGEVIYEI